MVVDGEDVDSLYAAHWRTTGSLDWVIEMEDTSSCVVVVQEHSGAKPTRVGDNDDNDHSSNLVVAAAAVVAGVSRSRDTVVDE